jgi:hypothetical protein
MGVIPSRSISSEKNMLSIQKYSKHQLIIIPLICPYAYFPTGKILKEENKDILF